MKQLFLMMIFVLILFSSTNGQVCTGDFSFTTQQEVDSFLIENPTCTVIDGDVHVSMSSEGSFIHNLDAFQNVTSITGDLIIEVFVDDFSFQGLSSLHTIGNQLQLMDYTNGVTEYGLDDLTGLENLNSVEILDFTITGNTDFTVFNGLVTFSQLFLTIEATSDVVFNDIFPNVIECGQIGVNMVHTGAMSFSGFHNLITLGDFSLVCWNSENVIYSFDAFDQVTNANSIWFDYCHISDYVSGFQNLQSVGNQIWFDVYTDNSSYIDLSQLETSAFIWLFGGHQAMSAINLNALTEVDYLFVSNYATALNLPVLERAGGMSVALIDSVSADFNQVIAPQLDSVFSDFQMSGLDVSDLSGFPSLQFIGGQLDITNCHNLSECNISAICERLSLDPSNVNFIDNAVGCNTIDEVFASCSISYVSGTVYADVNCDGVYNTGDLILNNAIIHNNNNLPVGQSANNGTYYLPLDDNSTTTIKAENQPWLLLSNEHTVTTSSGSEVFLNYDFALCPDFNYHDVGRFVLAQSPRPGFYSDYSIYATNHSLNTEDISVMVDLSAMPGATIISTTGTVSGSTISWNIYGLSFHETEMLNFQIYVSPSTPLGTQYHLYSQVTIDGGVVDADLSNNSGTLNQTVVGSYDPNDITVDRPDIDIASMTSTEGEWLNYTIRFQNTGTAEAINVRVQDVMEEDLDLSTFQQLNASHPFTLSFDENRSVEWLFENIMLPDSFSNEEASHGFIHFRIKTNPGLGLNDVIENSAAIYFDFNEPVITNTATTIFYECTQNAEIIGVADVCEGNDVALSSSGNWNNYTWMVDGFEVIADDQLLLSDLNSGSHDVSLQVTDTYCMDDATYLINVMAIPTTPVITQSGNTLTATGEGIFTWTLDGDVLDDTDNTIEITESGTYSVSVMESMCVSDVATESYEFVGVVESNGEYIFICYPNPVNEVLFIDLPVTWSGPNQIVISDQLGKVMLKSISADNHISLSVNSLASGVYHIMVYNESDGSVLTSQIFVE